MRAGLFSIGTLTEAWLGVAMEQESSANTRLVTEIERLFSWMNVNDPRFAGKLQRMTGAMDYLAWRATGLEFPFKLDAYKQSRLRGYITQYISAHSGQLSSITVDQMLADIARAHPDLAVDAEHAQLFLVQNRDGAGNILRDGIDPLNVNNEIETITDAAGNKITRVRPAWDANPSLPSIQQPFIARPGSGLTLQQLMVKINNLPGGWNAMEGFFIDTRDVTMRAVLTRKSRGEMVRENLLLLDVLAELAGIDNELRKTPGWWTSYITGYPIVP